MTVKAEGSGSAAAEASQEEIHCTRCGTYLGEYGPGTNGTVPCPKCKEPNVIGYTDEEIVIRRRTRVRA